MLLLLLGFVCRNDQISPGGCCDTSVTQTRRYICDTCLSSGCCRVYEHCVSCCLQPEKVCVIVQSCPMVGYLWTWSGAVCVETPTPPGLLTNSYCCTLSESL